MWKVKSTLDDRAWSLERVLLNRHHAFQLRYDGEVTHMYVSSDMGTKKMGDGMITLDNHGSYFMIRTL